MEVYTLSFGARATGPNLQLRVHHNGSTIFDQTLDTNTIEFKTELPDTGDHSIEIEMLGKLPEHTVLDDQDNIVQDRVIEIGPVCLDGLELGQLYYDLAEYTHDFNGTGDKITEKFYGTMGCNGVVKLTFTSPVYLWLLENM